MSLKSAFEYPFENDRISVVETRPKGTVCGLVLLVHGLGGQKNSDTHIAAAESFAMSDLATLRFDFPGHGESSGSTERLTIGRGAALVDELVKLARERFPGAPYALFGASFGGTCILASEACKAAAAVVLRSPVSDYQKVRSRQLGPLGLEKWKQKGVVEGLISRNRLSPWTFFAEAGTIDLYSKAEQEHAPLLIVHGEKDDTVPMEHSERLCLAWAGRVDLVKVKNGDHSLNDPLHTEIFVSLSETWISAALRML